MTSETVIHPTAIVEKGAQLDSGVYVGPYCLVGPHVKLGRGTRLISHAVVEGHTTLGEDNQVYPFASVGHPPQDLKYKGEATLLLIGNRNRIREGATLQPGTVTGIGKTVVGDDNLFMANTHVAHDCIVGNQNVFANGALLAGHVIVCNQTVLGGSSGVHQFCTVGDMALLGAAAIVVQDVPPFCTVEGNRAALRGMNVVAMRRRGISTDSIGNVKRLYKILFLDGYPTVNDALAQAEAEGLLADPSAQKMADAVRESKRGVCRPILGAKGDEG
jgi:UDP-N-acetylglucosamine acyltransferase